MLGPPGSGTSSRMRTLGFRMMARARDSRCRWPPDRSLSVTCAARARSEQALPFRLQPKLCKFLVQVLLTESYSQN